MKTKLEEAITLEKTRQESNPSHAVLDDELRDSLPESQNEDHLSGDALAAAIEFGNSTVTPGNSDGAFLLNKVPAPLNLSTVNNQSDRNDNDALQQKDAILNNIASKQKKDSEQIAAAILRDSSDENEGANMQQEVDKRNMQPSTDEIIDLTNEEDDTQFVFSE